MQDGKKINAISAGDTVEILLTKQIGKATPCSMPNHFRIMVGDHSAGVVPIEELKLITNG